MNHPTNGNTYAWEVLDTPLNRQAHPDLIGKVLPFPPTRFTAVWPVLLCDQCHEPMKDDGYGQGGYKVCPDCQLAEYLILHPAD